MSLRTAFVFFALGGCTVPTDDSNALTAVELCARGQSEELLRVRLAAADSFVAGAVLAHGAVGPGPDSPVCYQPATFAKAIDCEERVIELVSSEVPRYADPVFTCPGLVDPVFADGVPGEEYAPECAATAICEPLAGEAVGVLEGDRFLVESWEPTL
jgi:hypothetical protein